MKNWRLFACFSINIFFFFLSIRTISQLEYRNWNHARELHHADYHLFTIKCGEFRGLPELGINGAVHFMVVNKTSEIIYVAVLFIKKPPLKRSEA